MFFSLIFGSGFFLGAAKGGGSSVSNITEEDGTTAMTEEDGTTPITDE